MIKKNLMKNIKNLFAIIACVLLVSQCNTIKKGFTPDKKSGEEFLVKKKSPLVMPPSYNDLPIPNQEVSDIDEEKADIKSILSGSKTNHSEENIKEKNETTSSIEKMILEKIKKN